MSSEEFGEEAYPRDEWVLAFHQTTHDLRSATSYMVTDGGAFVRVQTYTIVKQPFKQQGVAENRLPPTGVAEAITFIPGDYTLKLKRGVNIVVLRKRK